MGDLAAVLKRVSTDLTRQEIANQDGDVDRVTAEHDLTVVESFELEASAYKGEHAPTLARILADVQAGRYTVVIAAMTSRFERRGWKVLMRWMLDLDAAGGRLIAADNPNFGDLSTPMGGMMTIMAGDGDHTYSDTISKNVNRANRKTDAEGSFRGSVPAGYMVTGDKRAKRLVPNVTGVQTGRRRAYASEVIATAIGDASTGTSTTTLGRRLGMTPDAVAKMLRNPVYSTGRYTVHRGDGVTVYFKTTPLVTPDVQAGAIEGLKARRTGDNVSSRSISKEDYSGALWCPYCDHQLYRYFGGGKKGATGRPTPKVRRYACKGRAGGCGRSVMADAADAEVQRVMHGWDETWWKVTHQPADTTAAELERTRIELDELSARRLPRAEMRAETDRLYDEIERLEALASESRPGRTYVEDSGKTLGQLWDGMTPAERREWMLSGEFRLHAKATPDRSGRVEITRTMIVPAGAEQ